VSALFFCYRHLVVIGFYVATQTRTHCHTQRERKGEREKEGAILREKAECVAPLTWRKTSRTYRWSIQRYQTDTARVHLTTITTTMTTAAVDEPAGLVATSVPVDGHQPPTDSSDGWTRTSANCWTAVERRRSTSLLELRQSWLISASETCVSVDNEAQHSSLQCDERGCTSRVGASTKHSRFMIGPAHQHACCMFCLQTVKSIRRLIIAL